MLITILSEVFVRLLVLAIGMFSVTATAAPSSFMFDDIQDRDPAAEEKSVWRASAEFGFLMRSGNTDSKSWKTKLDIQRDTQLWRHRGALTYDRAERKTDTGTQVDADRFFTSLQSNRMFGKGQNSSFFMYGSYEDDRKASFDFQSSIAAGYGSRYRYNENVFADFEIGPGLSYNKLMDGSTDIDSILRLATNIEWTISESARFTQLISTEIGADNTRSRGVSALTANLNSRLAMRLTMTLTHNSTVTPKTSGEFPEKLDTEMAVTLVYTF